MGIKKVVEREKSGQMRLKRRKMRVKGDSRERWKGEEGIEKVEARRVGKRVKER